MQVLSFGLSKCHKTEVLRILLGMFSFCPHTLCTRHHTIWVEQLLFLIPPRQLLFITNWNTFCLDKHICDLHCGESIPHTGTEAMAALGSGNVMTGRINISEEALIRQPWQQKVQGLWRWSWEPSEGTRWRGAATQAAARANASSLSPASSPDRSAGEGHSSTPWGWNTAWRSCLREMCLFQRRGQRHFPRASLPSAGCGADRDRLQRSRAQGQAHCNRRHCSITK